MLIERERERDSCEGQCVVRFDEKQSFSFEEPTVTGDTSLDTIVNTAVCRVSVGTVLQSNGALPHSPVVFVPFCTGTFHGS
jgi:hypothetical protein